MYLGNGKICFHSFELHFTYCIQLLSEEDRAVSLFLHAFPPRKLGHVISPAVSLITGTLSISRRDIFAMAVKVHVLRSIFISKSTM